MQFLVSLVALASLSTALPSGAPKCRIVEAAITKGHKVPQSSSLGFKLNLPTSYTPGGPAIPITITSAKPTEFQGILGYVSKGSTQDSVLTASGGSTTAPTSHVGAFQSIASHGLRAQTASACAALNVQNEAAESTITHASPLKNIKTPFTIMWKPPAKDEGVVTVNFVVTTGTKSRPWQIVPAGQIKSLGAVGDGKPPSPPSKPTVTKTKQPKPTRTKKPTNGNPPKTQPTKKGKHGHHNGDNDNDDKTHEGKH